MARCQGLGRRPGALADRLPGGMLQPGRRDDLAEGVAENRLRAPERPQDSVPRPPPFLYGLKRGGPQAGTDGFLGLVLGVDPVRAYLVVPQAVEVTAGILPDPYLGSSLNPRKPIVKH